jgi:hypothetical protein
MPPRKQTPTSLPNTNPDAGAKVDGSAAAAAETAAGALSADNASETTTADVGLDVEVIAEPIEIQRNPNWTVVKELSDDEFQVEVANIDGFQMRKCLLRFRVAGVLSPTIQVMEGIRYHGEKGFQSR